MKKSTRYLPGTLLVFAMLHPMLAAADELRQSEWYAGAGLGISRLNPDSNDTIFEVDDEYSSGYKLTLGYDWSERISVEGYYADLGEAKMSPHGEVKYQDLGLSGLYHFYQQELPQRGLEAFVKVGLGYMKNDSDLNYERDNDGHLMFGLGAGYGFDNGLMLRADLDLYDEDSQFLSVNLIKRFGGIAKASAEKVHMDPIAQPVDPVVPKEEKPRYVIQTTAPVVLDSDNDSVEDIQDVCPGTLEGVEVDSRGCATTWVLLGVAFEHNSDVLTAASRMILDQVANRLIGQKSDRLIRVVGHTDSSGPTAYSQQLSRLRADSVLTYLVQQGVDAATFSAVGKGESEPIADNGLAVGRVKNRRVELHWE